MESSLDKSLVGIRCISAGESGRISIPPPRSKEASWPLPLRDLEEERLELGRSCSNLELEHLSPRPWETGTDNSIPGACG